MATNAVSDDPSFLSLDVLDTQPAHQSKREILTGLFHSDPHRFQLEEWRIEEKALRDRTHCKEKNLSAAESEIYQLLALFFLFQGVVFSAVAQTSILRCEDWWSPFSMSLIVSMATLLALQQKLKVLADFHEELTSTLLEVQGLDDSIQKLIEQGSSFNLNCLSSEPRKLLEPQEEYVNLLSKLCFKYMLTHEFAVKAAVVVFSAIMLVSCPKILCRDCICNEL